jgi:TRAP-type mannitol/chloroaromatic compound transport system permease small subunit
MLPKPARSMIELIGHVFFLLPLTIIMIVTSVPFFLESFRLNEQSFSSGGLPQWPAKSLIMIGFALLAMQGISQIIKRIAIMRGIIPDPHETQRSALEAEVEHFVEGTEKS